MSHKSITHLRVDDEDMLAFFLLLFWLCLVSKVFILPIKSPLSVQMSGGLYCNPSLNFSVLSIHSQFLNKALQENFGAQPAFLFLAREAFFWLLPQLHFAYHGLLLAASLLLPPTPPELYVLVCSLDTRSGTNAGNAECFLTVSPRRHSSVQRQSDRSRRVKNEKGACDRISNFALLSHHCTPGQQLGFWKVKIVVTPLERSILDPSCELVWSSRPSFVWLCWLAP